MQSIWSEHWHSVRHLRPRLRDGVQVVHRRLRGRPWVMLIDPVTQRFHRATPGLWHVLRLMDGHRSLDEIWNAACALGGDGAVAPPSSPPTQSELVQLLSSLHANDLLQSQVTPDAAELFERHQRRQWQSLRQQWLNPLNIRIPLVHPDAWFQRRAGLARTLISWPMLFLWLALVLPAGVLSWEHGGALTDNLSDRVLSAGNLLQLWLVYPLVKAVHEFAHGLAVKRFGGSVREMGLIFMVLTPVPYVDASASYAFASKWQRALVAAAGIMAELLLGAVALFVWVQSEPGLVRAVAFNVVFIAGVSTLLVNGNPLMRYDGYFIATDLLEAPNLAQRAKQYWVYLADRWLFGSPDAKPPVEVSGERVLLTVYGLVAPVYRFVFTVGLIWFIAGEYQLIGTVLALIALWSLLVTPIWNAWKHLRRSPTLAQRRSVASWRTLVAVVAGLAIITLIPVPFRSIHQAVVWVPDEAIVRAQSAGFVRYAAASPGENVAAGQMVAELESAVLTAEVALAAAALEQVLAQLRRAQAEAPAKVAALRDEEAARLARLNEAQSRVRLLQVRSMRAGRWVPKAETSLAGRYVRRGEVLGYVVSEASAVVRTAVTQDDLDLVRSRLQGVQVRLAQSLDMSAEGRVTRQTPLAGNELVSAALGTSGGGDIAVDPSRPGGAYALQRVFDIQVDMARPSPSLVFGDRAFVRFEMGSTPLAWQWLLRLRQLFLSRLNV